MKASVAAPASRCERTAAAEPIRFALERATSASTMHPQCLRACAVPVCADPRAHPQTPALAGARVRVGMRAATLTGSASLAGRQVWMDVPSGSAWPVWEAKLTHFRRMLRSIPTSAPGLGGSWTHVGHMPRVRQVLPQEVAEVPQRAVRRLEEHRCVPVLCARSTRSTLKCAVSAIGALVTPSTLSTLGYNKYMSTEVLQRCVRRSQLPN